jgi:hypothetical protein
MKRGGGVKSSYRRTTEVEDGGIPEKCVVFPLFRKSIFRSFTCFSLLILYERGKKTFNFERVPRKGQDLNNRMCSHNLDSETTTQTFMLYARPSPLCRVVVCPCDPWKLKKHSPYWSCDESKKACFSGGLTSFLVCARKFIWLHAFLFSFVCMWHVACTNKNLDNDRVTIFLTYASSWSVRTFLKEDGVSNDPETFSYVMKKYDRACADTRTSQIVWQRGFFGLTTEQLDFQFQVRRCTWRSWKYLKLQCLCVRLRIGVVKTHSDVNSWPSHSPSSEHPLRPCLRTHFLRSVGGGREMTLQHTLSLESTIITLPSVQKLLFFVPPTHCQTNGRE